MSAAEVVSKSKKKSNADKGKRKRETGCKGCGEEEQYVQKSEV